MVQWSNRPSDRLTSICTQIGELLLTIITSTHYGAITINDTNNMINKSKLISVGIDMNGEL